MTSTPMTAQPVEAPPASPKAAVPTAAPAAHVHQPATYPVPHYQRESIMELIFSAKAITVMVVIGVILLFLGALLASTAMKTVKVNNDPDDRNDARRESYSTYKNGVSLMVAGNMVIVLWLLCGAVMSQNVPTTVKLGFLIFCAILVMTTIWLVLGYPSVIRTLDPPIID